MAVSSSTAANPNDSHYYDVFLSHRGPDVKKTFASYLYRSLLSHGLSVFLDKQELKQGETITSQIEGAIRSASVHVAIFSAGYADSPWCLNELLLMLESKAHIIPVFYNVKPTELRWTRGKGGVYAQALEELGNKRTKDPQTHEEKPRYDSNTIENWRNALSQVAEISGFELEAYNGDEGELLDKVVERVSKKVKKTGLDVAKYPTGLADKVKEFENIVLHQEQSGKPPIFGIVGLGGIGKTTLAKEFFNRKSSYYSGSCFLPDVRENAVKGSLNSLQSKLLKNLTGLHKQIDSVDEGIVMLRKHISCSSHNLIILDDVDHVNQVDALLPFLTLIHSDSLILITSRSKDVLRSSRVEESLIYELSDLNTQHSLELFCWHCFGQSYPLPEFECLVYKFVKACDGLPLSLIVFGALLAGKNEAFYWEDQLDRLQRILPTEIKQRLQLSYDTLEKDEQNIFLDIACFFIGENKDKAIRIWDGSRWKGRLGFHNLQNKCLVKVDSTNNIQMHDHLRDLGRDIAKASLPRRLWRPRENIDDLLQESESSVISVRGIRMVPGEYLNDNDDDDAFDGISMRRLQLLDTEDALLESILRKVELPNLLWIRWNKCPESFLPTWFPMKNLQVLQVSGNVLKSLWEDESQPPLQLRELEIHGPLSNIPKSIGKLKYLERFAISFSSSLMQLILRRTRHVNLEKLPEEFCHLQSLKVVVLRDCSEMRLLPESFGNLTNLQHIDLCKCVNLERLPISFGNLIKLKHLDLKGCSNLTISSETFGNISTLEYIDLCNCKFLEELPSQVAQQRSLDNLYLEGTNLKQLPSAIGELGELEILELGSPWLDALPLSLGCLRNLKKLKLSYCKELKHLPASVGLLTQLTEFRVWRCTLRELPFPKFKGDNFSLDEYMPGLKNIDMYETEISEVSFVEGVCPNLQRLHLERCNALVKVERLPNTLVNLVVLSCYNLKIIGLCGLPKLQILRISGSKEVEELPSMETLVSLEEFHASGCAKLKSIRGLQQLAKLRILSVSGCSELEELPGVERLKSLYDLYTSGCVKLKRIQGLAQLTKLRLMDVDWCDEIEELEGVEHLKSLEKLRARGCPKLQWREEIVEEMGQRLKTFEI